MRRHSEGKPACADCTVAVSRTKDQKTFFPIAVFGKLAGTCDVVKKGAKALLDGQLDISERIGNENQ